MVPPSSISPKPVIMDSQSKAYQSSNGTMSPGPEDLLNYDDFFNDIDQSTDLTSVGGFPLLQTQAFPGNFTSSEEAGSPGGSDSEILRYIRGVLMEENTDEKPSMFPDPLAIQAAEQPFYDVLVHNCPLSSNQHPLSDHSADNPDANFSVSSGDPSIPVGFDIYSDRNSMIQFQKGVEEASKFLPKSSNLLIDLDNMTFPDEDKVVKTAVRPENGTRGRKIRYLDDEDFEEQRSSKLSALSVEEIEDLSEMFDRVLLCSVPGNEISSEENFVQQRESMGFVPDGKSRPGRQDDGADMVDLRTMLNSCAQAVVSDDRRTAHEQLKQIRQHSSPNGDGSQRMAHYFANALQTRLEGTSSELYTTLASKMITTAQKLKAFHFFASFCPFNKLSIMFANLNILKLAENKPKLHIIDFGIWYGFQWPMLIQLLSQREEGPPTLRITGIEQPHSGFRPEERLAESGRRLAEYCERFGVPIEFNPIAKKWETVTLADLKLQKDEVVAVNCLYRFKNLLDDTIVADNPRDAVLKLIKNINPDIFVHGTVNGSFNAPFFITRFREALFYYSTLFDMLDTTPRDNVERSVFESEFYGREIMNIIACEATERVERPELYKQCQARIGKAGFRQLPLSREIMEKGKGKMQYYHKDYALNVDGNWALIGWKGRVMLALSAWVPSLDH